LWRLAAFILWLVAVLLGTGAIWRADNKPGDDTPAPLQWPAESSLSKAPISPTLIVFLHPKCPCSRASVSELADVLSHAEKLPKVYLVFVRPSSMGADWSHTTLWREGAKIPDVTIVDDFTGIEARAFHAGTAGRTLLYDERGILRFDGGVTASRGHAGSNPGSRSLLALLGSKDPERSTWPVFGCPLRKHGSSAPAP